MLFCMMHQIPPLPVVDFAELTADGLWSIFETKAFYGGTLAYAVFSRASKLGCSCSVALEKTREGRRKQLEDWRTWSSSFKERLKAFWSAPAPVSSSLECFSKVELPSNIIARVASLAVHSGSADWVEQVLCCDNDARRLIVPYLWLKIKEDFVFNQSWTPSYRSSFIDAVDSIDPSATQHTDVPWFVLADCWSRTLSNMCRIFASAVSVKGCDPHLVWIHCVQNPAVAIPISERAVMMWIWLLWSSSSLSTALNQALYHKSVAPDDLRSVEERLIYVQYLRSKRILTKDEFTKKRQRIIDSI